MARFENWEAQKEKRMQVEFFIHDSGAREIAVEEHWHDCMEIQYLLEGESLHVINGRSCRIGAGQLLVLNPGNVHGSFYAAGIHTKTAVLKFDEASLEQFRKARRFRYLDRFMQNKETVWHPDAAQREKIRAFLDQLQAEKGEKGRGYELIMQGIALQFAGYLVREGMLDWHGGEPTADIGPDLERIVHYIEENYMQDINLEKVAEELHMNYSYASRYFRKMTGKNFKEFLDFVRISEASRMLSDRRKSIAEIASACGFPCPQTMTRTYRRLLGVSPSALRAGRDR